MLCIKITLLQVGEYIIQFRNGDDDDDDEDDMMKTVDAVGGFAHEVPQTIPPDMEEDSNNGDVTEILFLKVCELPKFDQIVAAVDEIQLFVWGCNVFVYFPGSGV